MTPSKNTILLGDAVELIKQVPDKSIDLIITDPPYLIENLSSNKGFMNGRNYIDQMRECNLGESFDMSMLDDLVRVMKRINIYIWCNKEQIPAYLDYFVKDRGCSFEFIIWAKTNPPPFTRGHYLKDKEYCLFFREKGVDINVDTSTGKTVYVTAINKADKELYMHPTIKPEDIIENLARNSCPENGIILDPFSGSGTTCAVAKRLGLDYLGFEINPKWHAISIDRLNGITAKQRRSGHEQIKLF